MVKNNFFVVNISIFESILRNDSLIRDVAIASEDIGVTVGRTALVVVIVYDSLSKLLDFLRGG